MFTTSQQPHQQQPNYYPHPVVTYGHPAGFDPQTVNINPNNQHQQPNYKLVLPYLSPGSTPSPLGPYLQAASLSPQFAATRLPIGMGGVGGYRYQPLASAPVSPHSNDPIGRHDVRKGGRKHGHDGSSPSSPSRDPAKDAVRKSIQRKLRLKMIRKGTMPPNPTYEELTLCGMQPALPTYPYPFPYYYMPQPAAYDQNGQPIAFLPPSPYATYPMAPPQQLTRQQQQQFYGKQQQYQQPAQKACTQPPSPASVPRSIAYKDQFEIDALTATSSQMTMSPNPIQQCQLDDHHHTHDPQLESIFDFKMESLFTEDMLQEAEKIANGLEPFLLPDREIPASTFESFFGGDFVLDQQ